MNNNQSPQDFVNSLPVASTVGHDIATGDSPLPKTALLSEAERIRLDKLAATGESPVERPSAGREETFTTYDDGSVTKFFPRKGFEPQCVLVDATGKIIAITKDENIADWVCNALNLMTLASLKAEADGVPLQIMHAPVILPKQ